MQVVHNDLVARSGCCWKMDTLMWRVAEDTPGLEPHAVPKNTVDLAGIAGCMIQSEQTCKNIAELTAEGPCIAGS
jgi:hypothetical protein